MSDFTVSTGLPVLEPVAAAARHRAGALLVDVRGLPNRAANGTIPGAVVVDRTRLAELFTGAEPLAARDREIVVICGGEGGSGEVGRRLVGLGFPNVSHVRGAFPAWRDAGLPVDAPSGGGSA
ncbi:rhodanese-like domain-containing protein [Pseudonocardia sp. NPDC046786]|uniref:rhodanese-like domain-containing protein n=1 Tax=Pseudonocardia sp. NPDC046786 TaxID=3155471 RepID=UPI0033BFD4B3